MFSRVLVSLLFVSVVVATRPYDEIVAEASKKEIFTIDALKKYDGTNNENGNKVYLAVKGIVFDVTSGKSFYGPGSSYNALAGHDCTRAVALWSLKPEDMVPDISSLTEEQKKGLDEVFNDVYVNKYPIVGVTAHLVDSNEL